MIHCEPLPETENGAVIEGEGNGKAFEEGIFPHCNKPRESIDLQRKNCWFCSWCRAVEISYGENYLAGLPALCAHKVKTFLFLLSSDFFIQKSTSMIGIMLKENSILLKKRC